VDLKLLWREKVKMIRGSGSVTDRQAMANSLGEIGPGRLDASFMDLPLVRDGPRWPKRTRSRRHSIASIDEFSLEHIEELPS
jgi:hypothetical protein